MDDTQARERVARVDSLLEELETLPDPLARQTATEVVEALLDLYGEGLARLVGYVAERDDGALAAALAGDELVAHLLLLHGLHPRGKKDRAMVKAIATRSTGVNALFRNSIDPKAPRLTPM